MSDLQYSTTDELLKELSRRSEAICVCMIPRAMKPTDGTRAFLRCRGEQPTLMLLGALHANAHDLAEKLNRCAENRPMEPDSPTETDE